MTRDDADEAFDCLTRHARALKPPGDAAAALALLDGVALAPLQRAAIVHYISVGPAVVNLAYRVLKSATATLVAARFAAAQAGDADLTAPAVQRELLAERILALGGGLTGADPAARAAGLTEALWARLAAGRLALDAQPVLADRAVVGDLLEAAGIAYLLAQLLENPPAPAVVLGNGR
ncbi:MAG: hypothetical protein QOF77_1144 [Solirubrobacteraceae bacterium]|jgi:hypothetical protein|nr:hypothetical protein [Solirubrobacteraceae bacterium]